MTTPPTRATDPLRKLTPREAQAIAHLAAGHDLQHTASALGVTPGTARNYLHRAMRKLGCPTESAAVALIRTAPPTGPGRRPPDAPARPDASPAATGEHGGVTADPAAARDPSAPRPGGKGRHRRSPGREGRAGGAPTQERTQDTRTAARAGAPPEAPETPETVHEPLGAGTDTAAAAVTEAGTGTAARQHAAAPRHTAHSADPGAPTARDGRPQPTAGQDAPAVHPAPGRAAAPERHAPAPRTATPAPVLRGAPAPSADRRERIELALTEAGSGRDLSDEPAPSFDDLYEQTYTRLVQQVFLLTACRHRAVHCVRRAFGQARRGWDEVIRSGDPEGWVRVRASELALSPWHRGGPRRAHAWTLPHRRIRVRPANEAQAVLPDHDRLTDRDKALLKALRRLSRPQRRALVLHDGLGLPAAAIAVEVESTLAAAEGRVWAARAALAQSVPDLVGPDPTAPGFADGLSGLLHRAAVRGCPEPHRSPVPVLRARHRLSTASRTGAAALLTVAVGGATVATLAGLRPAALFQPRVQPTPALCVPAPTAEVEPPGVPLLPGGAPNGIASLWCSPAAGLEAVVVDRQPQAVARWELPPSVVQAPPPQQGPAACPLWSPLPCTTGPRH
ncbi:sigma factor-like helix-turn-helix DNA-binding protein [Kitasatospora sp. NPDC048194]|uniref:sigma factor-like helix-turn-helix DNA-binding protein n=1 Tax=Kitasatospora sp. NPDC048194 TaxID=3364045 RepID=UPI003716B52C